MGDIKESVAELAYYRDTMFRPPASAPATTEAASPATATHPDEPKGEP
jgi:hypothetical protein